MMQGQAFVNIGKQIRYDRIVNPETGKMVIVPMDHGIILGPLKGIEHLAETVRKVVTGGADSILFNASMARWIYSSYMNQCGSIFNLTNIVTSENDLTLINSVQYALSHAADAISVQVMIGSPHERHMLNNFRIVAEECQRWGLPLLAMMYPTEDLISKMGDEAHLLAARAGAEMGADIVKTSYTGNIQSFTRLVDACPAPVVIAGGPQKGSPTDTLTMVKEAMSCGASGIALGRNIWQSEDPEKMTNSLVQLVHHGKNIENLHD